MPKIEYTKSDCGRLTIVDFELDCHGLESFREREVSSLNWTAFVPTEEERQVAHRLLEETLRCPDMRPLRVTYDGVGDLSIDWIA